MTVFTKWSLRKKRKAYEVKRKAAMLAQRSGDIQGSAELSEEADNLLRELRALQPD